MFDRVADDAAPDPLIGAINTRAGEADEHAERSRLQFKLELAYPGRVGDHGADLDVSPHVRELYPVYLTTMHGVVRSAVALMDGGARARAARWRRRRASRRHLIPYFEHHAPEEAGHDEWLLEDLEAVGGDADAARAQVPSRERRDARRLRSTTGCATSTRSRCSGTWR